MKLIRAIAGIFLSLVFLSVMFFVLQGAWSLSKDKNLFLGNVLGSVVVVDPVFKNESPKPVVPYRDWNVQDLMVESESAIAVESSLSGSDKILFKKNNYVRLPIASLTKLMTATIAIENYSPDQIIKVTQEAVLEEGARGALEADKEMTVEDLIYIMLIESSNHAAYTLSEGMDKENFVRLMNEKAIELGMDNTFFVEPTGLYPENISTADDLVKLAKYILKNHREIAQISKIKEYNLPGYGLLSNTNELLSEIQGIVAGKTGFTIEAKGCLFLILKNFQKDGYLMYIILGADERFVEMKKMIDWVDSAYQWQ